MYVYYCGLDGSACSRIGESGGPTSEEQFNLYRPVPGVYGVYIHGFETDEISGGPGSNYQLLAWSIGIVEATEREYQSSIRPITITADGT